MSSISQTAGRSEANLRFSRKLATLQLLAVLALALIIGVTATVFARQQAVSANSAERKAVAGAIATLEAGLKAATLAHAVSGAAYEAVRAADHASFWRNVAHGEIASGTTDIMVAVDPLRGTRFAWGAQSGPEPSDQILPAGLVDDMAQRADAAADGPRGAVSRFARFDGQTWLLAAARMTRNDGVPEDATGSKAPRLILGFRLDGGRLAQLGGLFGIEGLTVTDAPSAGAGALRLGGQAEGAGFATWTPAPVALAVDVWIVLVLAAGLVA